MSNVGHEARGESESRRIDLFPAVYEQLRALARGLMAGERPGHTLQPTALVSEAFVRLAQSPAASPMEQAAFFRSAAQAMRHILIDHARKRGAVKRGSGWKRAALTEVDPSSDEDCARLLALDESILRLESEDARAAEIVRLRFFAGLGVDQVAETTGLSRRTVLRDWEYARAWLADDLARESDT